MLKLLLQCQPEGKVLASTLFWKSKDILVNIPPLMNAKIRMSKLSCSTEEEPQRVIGNWTTVPERVMEVETLTHLKSIYVSI